MEAKKTASTTQPQQHPDDEAAFQLLMETEDDGGDAVDAWAQRL